jgi:hypothetical protein
MKQNNLIKLITLAFLLNACGQNNNITHSAVKKIVKDSINFYNRLIVIPGEGCSGCISDAGSFVKDNIDSLNSTLIIFTNISDKKMLSLKFGRALFIHENVKLDTDNFIAGTELASIYPLTAQIKNGSIQGIETFAKETFKK